MSRSLKSISMRPLSDLFPPLAERLRTGRPVLARDQMLELNRRILAMSAADSVAVTVTHTLHVVTRMTNGRILSSTDGETLSIAFSTKFGGRGMRISTNQVDDQALRMMMQQCETLARDSMGRDQALFPPRQVPDLLVPTALWKESTIQAMTETRGVVIPEVLDAVKREGLRAAGFLGLMARSESFTTSEGISVYSEETDSELTVTAQTEDGTSSGWGGQAARDWSAIRPQAVAARAVEMAKRGRNPVALEPGRRTAILSPEAVTQIVRYLAPEFSAYMTDQGRTALSKKPSGNKLGQQVFDPRISMRSDPADPDGGYRPYFERGLGTPAMTWVENGVLKNMAYDSWYAMQRGKAYAEQPWSIRLSGGTTPVEQMIAQCENGIYVNRLSSVDLVSLPTGLTTGVTRDGAFLVRNGKIERGIKNFRFRESPFFFLNRIEALGVPIRAAFGYTPLGRGEDDPFTEWPRRPIIAPPMMVRDFNFSALADAV
jgi:predicted Zn-dependent protease